MKKDYFNPTGTNEREPLDKEILFND